MRAVTAVTLAVTRDLYDYALLPPLVTASPRGTAKFIGPLRRILFIEGDRIAKTLREFSLRYLCFGGDSGDSGDNPVIIGLLCE